MPIKLQCTSKCESNQLLAHSGIKLFFMRTGGYKKQQCPVMPLRMPSQTYENRFPVYYI